MGLFRKTFGSANYLVAFEAAVRLGSFTKAAGELNVTQPAISRQIRELERHLGFDLFKRQAGRILPTYCGDRLYESVSTHLREIALTGLNLRQEKSSQRLICIHTIVVNATHWLLPALPDFHSKHPNIKLRVIASDDPLIDDDSIDISIRFGRGNWPGTWSRLLLDEVIFPVCSPRLIERLGQPASLEDLAGMPLLQLEANKGPWLDWRNWFSCLAKHPTTSIRQTFVGNYSTVIHAAVQGQGIALGWKYMVADDLRSGRLLCPLNIGISSEYGEALIVRPEKLPDPELRTVCAWLLWEARKTRRINRSIMPEYTYDGSQIAPAFPTNA